MDKAENNKFPGNPGIMADGRLFTDYRPNRDICHEIDWNALGHHHNDHLTRQYFTANGQNLMNKNYKDTEIKCKCNNINSQNYVEPTERTSILDYVARPKNMM